MASWLSSLFRRRPQDAGPAASVEYSVLDTPASLNGAFGSSTSSGATVTPSTAMAVAAVYRCVDLRATALACLPLHVIAEQANGSVGRKVSDHALAKLFKRPNRRHTGFEFRRLMAGHVMLRGNAYALKVRSAGGRVISLIPMHPDRTRVEELADQSLRYTYTRANGAQVTFTEDEVFHLRDLSTDGIVGLSRIAMMREAIGVAIQAEKFAARLFSNGIGVGGAVKHPAALSDASYERLKASMEARAGADQAHKWMVLEEGMSIEKLGLTSEDMQFMESRKFQRSEIAMFFGVPPHLIGDVEKTTSWGTGIEQQNLGFLQYTLSGDIAMWEQRIELDLVPANDNVYVKHNVAGFLRSSSKDRGEYFARALGAGGQQAWMTPNEVRALDDLPPIEGGDKLPSPMGHNGGPPPDNPAPEKEAA